MTEKSESGKEMYAQTKEGGLEPYWWDFVRRAKNSEV
jgi:hypothetical protein